MVHKSIILALGRLRQEDYKFETSLGYIVRFLPPPHFFKTRKKMKLLINNKMFG
jgi:hypothetical protein